MTLGGSRANRDCPADKYQDFDVAFYVDDVAPFWDNVEWIAGTFGMPSLVHKPESMELIPPDRDGNYFYLMIFRFLRESTESILKTSCRKTSMSG